MNEDAKGLINALLEHECAKGADDLQTALRDALTDMMHYADHMMISFEAAAIGAEKVFLHEEEIANA